MTALLPLLSLRTTELITRQAYAVRCPPLLLTVTPNNPL
jgi:hypothetical protein